MDHYEGEPQPRPVRKWRIIWHWQWLWRMETGPVYWVWFIGPLEIRRRIRSD